MTKKSLETVPDLLDNLKEIERTWYQHPGELFAYRTYCSTGVQAYGYGYHYYIGLIGGEGRRFKYAGPDRRKEKYEKLLKEVEQDRKDGKMVGVFPGRLLNNRRNWKIPVKRFVGKAGLGGFHTWGFEALVNKRFLTIYDETCLIDGEFYTKHPKYGSKNHFTIIVGNEAVYDWLPGAADCFKHIADLLNFEIKDKAFLQRLADERVIVG